MKLIPLVAAAIFCSQMAAANEITYDNISFVEERSGASSLDGSQWTLLSFDVKNYRINGTCYLNCRLRFTIDSVIDNRNPRYHIGIKTGETVLSSFAVPAENAGNPNGYIGVAPYPQNFNSTVSGFPPADLLTLAWIVENTQELIDSAVASGRIHSSSQNSWSNKASNFERALKAELRFLGPYIGTIKQ